MDYTVEYDEENGEYVASTPLEDYCTPSVHLAYIWLDAAAGDPHRAGGEAMSEHLARALLPPDRVSARRSPARATPTLDWVDRALLAAAALTTAPALWLLCYYLRMGL